MATGEPRRKRPKAAARKRRRAPKPAAAPGTDRPRRSSTLLRGLGIVVALAVAAACVGLLVVYPSSRGPGPGRSVTLVLAGGESPEQLAASLAGAGVLASPRLFALWVRATGGASEVVAGDHLVTDDASPRDLLARLERRGRGPTAHVTFPEGWTRFDIARRLEEKHVALVRDVLAATTDPELLRELGIDGDSAEGFLFPATYDFPLDGDPREVVRRMKREFDRRWDLLSRARSASLTDVMTSAKLDLRGMVTLASLVEKEAAVDEERPVIASVFLNRLRDPAFRPKRLECDPTAAYGCLVMPEKAASCANFAGKPTAAIEHDPDNPYSTYTHEGMPPGPIANPGTKSLDAAMAPENTQFYYFVAKGGGHHTFSETYDAHLAAVHDAGARSR